MIPKSIHYCWFGEKPLPTLAKTCISTWEKYCPDYHIQRWDESNIDLNENDYIKEAYEEKKWAFITDYVRLKVLYEKGGIYMDTDVELLKSLDDFLNDISFSGFESEKLVPTGIMASEPGVPIFRDLLEYYMHHHFKKSDGTLDMTPNTEIITSYCQKNGLVLDNKKQIINDFTLYPKEYFCPKDADTGRLNITSNTACIHHFDGSWLPEDVKDDIIQKTKYFDRYGRFLGRLIFGFNKYTSNPEKIWGRILYIFRH